MEWYPWLAPTYRQMIAHYQTGRAHPVFLLATINGMGDASLVWAVSCWLLCRQRQGIKSCKQCHGCQLMQAHTHPDWYRVTASEGKTTLGVDAIRQIITQLHRHGQQGGMKVIWLPDANQLSEAAANALLKTLEEPPANCHFFLSSKAPDKLLSTLRSRCIVWRLLPHQEMQSIGWLTKQCHVDVEACTTALRLSGGAPIAARTLLAPEVWQARAQLCQALTAALKQDVMILSNELNHDTVLQRMDWAITLFMDAIKWHRGGQNWLNNLDQLELIKLLANKLSTNKLNNTLTIWLTCRHHLQQNTAINRELLLTVMLLDWEQIFKTTNEYIKNNDDFN